MGQIVLAREVLAGIVAAGRTHDAINVLLGGQVAVFRELCQVCETLVVEFVAAQAPPQLENVAPGFRTAVRFTVVLFANDVPVGDCVFVPGPATLVENMNFVTVERN